MANFHYGKVNKTEINNYQFLQGISQPTETISEKLPPNIYVAYEFLWKSELNLSGGSYNGIGNLLKAFDSRALH